MKVYAIERINRDGYFKNKYRNPDSYTDVPKLYANLHNARNAMLNCWSGDYKIVEMNLEEVK
jgi:hypothetical protein